MLKNKEHYRHSPLPINGLIITHNVYTIFYMKYEWEQGKYIKNLKKHGVEFERVYGFDWSEVVEFEDVRHDYHEIRMVAFGPVASRLYCLVYTMRSEYVHVISLRKANRREVNKYA